MRIAAITKLKQGDIFELLKKLNWSQAELARKTGIDPRHIGSIINLKCKPKKETIEKIITAFANAGEFIDVEKLWPETFIGLKNNINVQIQDIPNEYLIETNMDEQLDNKLLISCINQEIQKLPTNMKEIMERRYFKDEDLLEIANDSHVTPERIRQIESKAIHIIRRRMRKSGYNVPPTERVGWCELLNPPSINQVDSVVER